VNWSGALTTGRRDRFGRIEGSRKGRRSGYRIAMADTKAPTDPEIMKALGAFASKVAVPILYDDPRAVDQIGTGTLFAIKNRLFLVTAAHLFNGHDPARFAIPSVHSTQLWSLGRCNLLVPTDNR
jgi:hypothetical protein